MNPPHVTDRYQDGRIHLGPLAGAKTTTKNLLTQYYHFQAHAEELGGCHDDQTTGSNTPSLTTGSSQSDAMSPSLCGRSIVEQAEPASHFAHGPSTSGDQRFISDLIRAHELDNTDAAYTPTHHRAANDPTSEEREWESSDSEDDDDDSQDDDDDDDDNNASDQDEIDALVLAVFGGDQDLGLAAHLIPILFKEKYSRYAYEISRKVGPWCKGVNSAGPNGPEDADEGDAATSSNGAENGSGSSGSTGGRKRQRVSSSDNFNRSQDDGKGEENEESDGGGGGQDGKKGDSLGGSDVHPLRKVACPFHKQNPDKYGIQHYQQTDMAENSKKQGYRACAGPGFRTIQRLKEHLKRVHSPVQCDRCFETFLGSDRAASIMSLEEHRTKPEPCEKVEGSHREGISESQWAKLDQLRKGKKKNVSWLAIWASIWKVLFPDLEAPTPWYDSPTILGSARPRSEASQDMAMLFKASLDYKVQGGDICFPPGMESIMKDRLVTLAVQTFELISSNHSDKPSTDKSSSRPSNQQSSGIGGSATTIPSQSNSRWSGSTRQLASTPASTLTDQHMTTMAPLVPQHQMPNQFNPSWSPMTGTSLVPTAMQAELTPRHSAYPPFLRQGAPDPDYHLFSDWTANARSEFGRVGGSEYDLSNLSGDGGPVFDSIPNLNPSYM